MFASNIVTVPGQSNYECSLDEVNHLMDCLEVSLSGSCLEVFFWDSVTDSYHDSSFYDVNSFNSERRQLA